MRSRLTIAVAALAIATACIRIGRATSAPVPRPAPSQADRLPHDILQHERLHKGHIDIATGLYIREDDDLVVTAGLSPIPLRRTYRSRDRLSRPFGIGTMHPGEWYLIGDGERFSWAALILADGGRIYFDRVSEGTSWADARFRHTKTTSSFWDSTLEWSDSRWLMRFKDGSEAVFQACSPTGGNICSIVERRTADGHRILYRRDASGQLLAIESGAETIMLDYDQQRRIVEARHSNGERVMYTYDDEGRLSRVAASDGTIRTYTYGPRHEMLTIREPGWFIENWFDESGRCIRQTTYVDDRSEALTLTFSYSKNDRAGTQTNVVQYDGTRTRYQFDENGQTVSVTYDADSIAPLTASYDRNPATNHVEGLTITCVGPTGNVSRTVHASPIPANQLSSRMIRLACR